jgi:MFS family permease
MSGILLALTGYLFSQNVLTAQALTACWTCVFFFASAAASSAYLTASEIFPLEMRALAIATFYALGTAIGGSAAPLLFGYLVGTGEPWAIAAGYIFAAALMLAAALAEARLGIDAEMRSLEEIAAPLSSEPTG